MRMSRFLIVAGVALSIAAAAVSAHAADMATKAAPVQTFKGYPYGSSGFFFGIYTEGGAGAVSGSAPGVDTSGLTQTQAGVGGTIGYAWGKAGSPMAASIEADFGWTNFNGNTAGLSLDGPAAFEQRFVIFTPLASVLSLLPNLPTLGTVPPFGALPAGISASNLQVGLMAGIDENDISLNFAGLSSNKEWRVAPMIGLVSMEQLSNGVALRTWIKTVFPDRGACIGPIPVSACGGLGQQVKVGVGIYY